MSNEKDCLLCIDRTNGKGPVAKAPPENFLLMYERHSDTWVQVPICPEHFQRLSDFAKMQHSSTYGKQT